MKNHYDNETWWPKDPSIAKVLKSCETCIYDGKCIVGCPSEQCHDCCQLSNWEPKQGSSSTAERSPYKADGAGSSPAFPINNKGGESSLTPINEKEIEVSTTNTQEGPTDQPSKAPLICKECGCYLDPLTGMPHDSAEYREIIMLRQTLEIIRKQKDRLAEALERALEAMK
jgi:hypothetical protein